MKEFIVEANHQEFYKRYKRGKPFAIISASRGNFTKTENKNNNMLLRKYIKKEGYDMIRVIGHYQEDDDYSECMVVFAEPEQEKDFIKFLLFFGRKYFQNSIILVDKDSNIWQYSTKQHGTMGAIGKKTRYDKFYFSNFDSLIDMYCRKTYQMDAIRIIND